MTPFTAVLLIRACFSIPNPWFASPESSGIGGRGARAFYGEQPTNLMECNYTRMKWQHCQRINFTQDGVQNIEIRIVVKIYDLYSILLGGIPVYALADDRSQPPAKFFFYLR